MNSKVSIRHIEIFHAVMIHRSISGAARMLNLSQPAVTRLLQHAEYHWGVQLFDRVKNRLVPTNAAQQLFPEIEHIYQNITGVRNKISHLHYNDRQHIRMAAPTSLSQHLMPLVVNHINQSFPQAILEIHTMHSRAIVSQLMEHKIDIGIIHMAIDHPPLTITHLAHDPLYVVYPKDWEIPPDSSSVEKLSLLAQKTMIFFLNDTPVGHVINTWLESIGIETFPRILLDNCINGLSMVASGIGWSIANHASLYVHKRLTEDIKILDINDIPFLSVYLAHSKDLIKTPLTDRCIKSIYQSMETYLAQSR